MNMPFIIGLIVVALAMIYATILVFHNKNKKPQNRVYFYVTRDKNGELSLWFGKPCRGIVCWVPVDNKVLLAAGDKELNLYNLKKEDYKDLKWEDEPKEVFLNLED